MSDEPIVDTALTEIPKSKDLVRSASAMSVLTAVSRGTGFLRIAVVTNVLGTTYLANTYETANTVPNVLFELLAAGALQAVLIPTMVELVDGDDRGEAEHVVGAVLGLTCAVLAAVAIAAAALAPEIMRLLFDGVSDHAIRQAEVNLGTFFLWFFLPQVLFYVGNVVATALLNAGGSFSLPVFAPTINNIVVIGAYLLFDEMHRGHPISLHITTAEKLVLGGGTTLGVIAFCAAPIIAAGRRFRLRVNLDYHHPTVRRLAKEGSWAAIYLALAQVLLVVILQISNRREGAVAVYNLAYILFLLPHSLFSVPVLTTRFPTLTRQFRDGDHTGYGDNLAAGMRSIGFLTLPATGLLITLALPATRVIVHGSAAHRAREIAEATAGFAPGILGFGLVLYLTRALYAQRDARTPTIVNALIAVIGTVVMFVGADQVSGRHLVAMLGLAYAVAQTIGAAILLWVIVRRLRSEGVKLGSVGSSLVRNLVAAGVASAVAWGVARAIGRGGTIGALLEVAAGGIVGLVVFVLGQNLLGGPAPIQACRTLGAATRHHDLDVDVMA